MHRRRVLAVDGDLEHLEAAALQLGVVPRVLGERPRGLGPVVAGDAATGPALEVVEDLPQPGRVDRVEIAARSRILRCATCRDARRHRFAQPAFGRGHGEQLGAQVGVDRHRRRIRRHPTGLYGCIVDDTEFVEAGLYDATAPNAADRLALLRWIAEHGIGVDEMVQAKEFGSLTGLVADRVIRSGDRIALAPAASDSGLTADQIRRVWQAAGFPPIDPDRPTFTAGDVDTMRAFALAAQMFGWGPTLQFTRVIGASLARVAEAAVSLFTVEVEAGLAARAAGELALAQANLEGTVVLSGLPEVLDVLFRSHVEHAIARSRATRVEGDPYGTARLAVGFVDLVGFTPLSLSMPTAELASMVEDFEGRAADVVVSRGGRVVKLIGDEVMFAALDPAAACAIALDLVDEFRDSTHVAPRGGVAAGIVITRGGDYYGPVVNLAARIADLAVPSEVLVTAEVAESEVGFRFEPAGRRMLKGFAEPVLLYAASR